jgi:hypothetical protein
MDTQGGEVAGGDGGCAAVGDEGSEGSTIGCTLAIEGCVDEGGAAANDEGGEGLTMGCATAVDCVAGGAMVGRVMSFRFVFFGSLAVVAAVSLNIRVAASSTRATLASLNFFLQSKHVRRGFIVPFLMFSRK